jgi:hypothetical protein
MGNRFHSLANLLAGKELTVSIAGGWMGATAELDVHPASARNGTLPRVIRSLVNVMMLA